MLTRDGEGPSLALHAPSVLEGVAHQCRPVPRPQGRIGAARRREEVELHECPVTAHAAHDERLSSTTSPPGHDYSAVYDWGSAPVGE
jgi:hypothetical protein